MEIENPHLWWKSQMQSLKFWLSDVHAHIVLFAPPKLHQTQMESIYNLLFYTQFLHTVIAVLFMALLGA